MTERKVWKIKWHENHYILNDVRDKVNNELKKDCEISEQVIGDRLNERKTKGELE